METPRKYRRKQAILMTALMLASPLLTGCVGGGNTPSCGEGTGLVGDECLPVITQDESEFTLRAENMQYIGVGGDINDIVNPDLVVELGNRVTITIIMGETSLHDVAIEGYDVASEQLIAEGSRDSITFIADEEGAFAYFCSVPGHRSMGMEGSMIVGDGAAAIEQIGAALDVDVDNIAKDPFDIPAPVSRNESATVDIYMEAVEVTAEIEDGTTFSYWTYNGTVPGPMFRARVGDTVVVHFSNDVNSTMHHNVDFHAVTGQGGGAAATESAPGETTTFSFLAQHAGLFVYHCATPDVPTHISKGMYGLILIEPEAPLPEVDNEIYIMQGDIYTKWKPGTDGHQEFDDVALFEENPTYVVFNGKFHGFTGDNALQANVGESMRIYFGVGGPNTISSIHVIGEVFDRVWNQADLVSDPMISVQTTLVPPGGAVVVDLEFDVPANYILVDHALTRAFHKGAIGIIQVTGAEDTAVYNENPE